MNTVIKHQNGRRELAQIPEVEGYNVYQLLVHCGCPAEMDKQGKIVIHYGDFCRWYLLIHAYNRVGERIRAVDRVDSRFAQELRDIREEMIWRGDIYGWLELANMRLNAWESEHLARLMERWL